MKERQEIEAYIKKLGEAVAKEKKAYESKTEYSKQLLSKDLIDRFETQIRTLEWVLKG